VILLISAMNFVLSPEEEAGSAEEQPASNKGDDYTIINGSGIYFPAAFLLSVISMA
jgi:hypothetical protein